MITLTQPTPSVMPSYNRILYRIVSNNASNIGFKYVVKVYNGADELMATAYYDSPANPADEVEFDVSKLVSTEYSFGKGFYETATLVNDDSILKEFYLKCYEYYEVDGEYVIILSTEVVSAVKFGLAASLPLLELKNWYANYNNYNGTSNTIYNPLSDWSTIKLRTTDSQVFGFYNNNKIVSCELKVYYTNGTNSTFYINATSVANPTITYFKITPLTYGNNVSYIETYINWNNGSARRSKFATLYIQACGKYDPMRIAYLNKFGTYDFMNFDLVNKTTFEIERKGYQRGYSGDIYEANGVVVKNINPVYYVKESQKWKIISDYLTDTQSELLRYLYSSPLVYLNIVNDNYITPSWIPSKVVPNSYEVKRAVSDKLFNLELDLEFALVNQRQSV
jgi:hypothetical protein